MINNTRDYMPGIDGLRAIAVLSVIIFHMNVSPFFGGGFIGVDIFFVISGYVISRSLYNRPSERLSGYLSEFYKRRVKRIVPALMVCLLVTIIASTLFIPPFWLSDAIDKTGLAAFWGYSNFALVWNNDGYFSPNVELNPFLHTWSLAVEEQFYLLFPVIFYLWLKFRKEQSKIGIIFRVLLPVLGLFSLGFSFFETEVHHEQAFYLLPSRFWELAAGAILFQFHSKNLPYFKSKNVSRLFLIFGFILTGIGFVFANQRDFPFPWAIVPVSASMLLINGIVKTSDTAFILYKFLNSSVITYVGKISYSLYLWHWPVAVLLRWTVGFNSIWLMLLYLAASFLLAIISYHFIEIPVRSGKILSKQQNWKIITGSIAVLLITYFLAQLVVLSKETISMSVTKDSYIWRSGYYERDEPIQPVTVDPSIAGRKLFALGDSHTAAYRTMLHIVSGQLGIEVHEYEQGDCAVAGLLEPMSENSASFYLKALSEIKKSAKPGDIVFLASLRMPVVADRYEVMDAASVAAKFSNAEASGNRQLALVEADRIIQTFEDLGLSVLIDAPKPVIKVPLFRCSDWFNKMNPIASPGFTISRDFLLEIRKPVMESLSSLQKKHKKLYIWDPLFVLCKNEEFSAYDDQGLPIFYDGDHLSANGNRLLVPSFKEQVQTILRK
jgi:peptidoglycan/LPS O-acetylase OafA/YrhL